MAFKDFSFVAVVNSYGITHLQLRLTGANLMWKEHLPNLEGKTALYFQETIPPIHLS